LKKIAKELGCKVIVTQQTNRNEGLVQAAKEANGDALLFLDGNIVPPASQLRQFLEPILKDEAEVVLNNLDRSFLEKRVKHWPDSYTVWKQVLNDVLGHTELNIDSLLSMPHAITKKAIQMIGYDIPLMQCPLVSFAQKNNAHIEVCYRMQKNKISKIT
jgi:hypothetical protein